MNDEIYGDGWPDPMAEWIWPPASQDGEPICEPLRIWRWDDHDGAYTTSPRSVVNTSATRFTFDDSSSSWEAVRPVPLHLGDSIQFRMSHPPVAIVTTRRPGGRIWWAPWKRRTVIERTELTMTEVNP